MNMPIDLEWQLKNATEELEARDELLAAHIDDMVELKKENERLRLENERLKAELASYKDKKDARERRISGALPD